MFKFLNIFGNLLTTQILYRGGGCLWHKINKILIMLSMAKYFGYTIIFGLLWLYLMSRFIAKLICKLFY